jgi:AAA family ATP:ADP antiporter
MALTINTINSKVFNLKKGEEKVVMLLTLYSFFMGLAYAYFYTASTSLFVGKFDISVLPYAYMGQGVVSYIVWLLFKRLQRYISFSKLFIAGGIFLLISVCGLSFEYIHNQSKASAFALFVWYNIFLLLNGIGFWGIAAKIFNISQAKRLFGLIGSGEILARVISFLSVPLLLKVIKTSDLFYLSMAGLVICLFIMPMITRYLSGKINTVPTATVKGLETAALATSIFKNRYFMLIFVLALFPLFATFYVDFIFLGQVKIQFVNAKVISGFISIFMGSMSVAEFILKTFVSGRVLTKYSLLFSLLLLPVLLAFSTLLAATLGTFYGTVGLFFSFIILSRLFVRVVRTLFFDTSFQILYQPVPVEDRLALQSKVEGVSKSIGFIFAGGMLVLLAKAKFINVVIYNYIFLVIIALWIWVSYKLYNEYKHLLKSVISKLSGYKADEEKKQAKTASRYMAMVDTHNVQKSGIAFNLLEKIAPTAFNLIMLRLLPKSNAPMQQLILQKLRNGNISIAIPVLDFCLKNNHVNGLATLFEEVKEHLNTVQRTNYESAVNLSRSNKVADRIAVAHLMAFYQNYNSYKILLELLHDDVWPVRNAALMSSGNIKKRELWPLMVQSLLQDETAYSATYAIKHVGDALLPHLAALLNRVDLPKNSYIRLVKTIADIDSPKVERVLISHLKLVEPDIRNNIFTALYNRHYQFPVKEHHAIKEYIEAEIEIIVWIAAAIVDIEQAKEAQALKSSLELEFRYKIGFTFKLLSMMYDANVIRFFINSFENSSTESRAYAMEVLNMTISADLRELVMPLLNDLSYVDLVQAYSTNYTQQRLPVQERLTDIINKDYTKINYWTKAMAVNLLATFPGSDEVLAGQMLSHNKLYCETVLWKLHHSNPYLITAMTHRLNTSNKERIFERTKRFKNINFKRYLLTDVIGLFKQHPFFKNLPMFELMNLCEVIKQQYLAAGSSIALTDENDTEAAYFVMNGHLRISSDFGETDLTTTQMYWYIQEGPSNQLSVNAAVNTAYIRISASTLYELLADNPIRIKKMINTLSAVPVKEAVL